MAIRTQHIILVLLFSLSICFAQDSGLKERLKAYPQFNTEMVNSWEAILQHFDRTIVELSGEPEPVAAYKELFHGVIKNVGYTGMFPEEILNELQQTTVLLNSIRENNTFHYTWIDSKSYRLNKTYLTTTLAYDSPYTELLRIVAEKDETIAEYYKTFLSGTDILPTMVALFVKHPERVDFNDPCIRLIWAVHYITLFSEEVEIE